MDVKRMSRAAASLLLLLLLATPALAADPGAEQEFLDRLNRERVARGRAPLRMRDAATGVARDWSDHMARTGRLEHRPDLQRQFNQRVTRSWTKLGENVGVGGDVAGLHRAFMESPDHRVNILDRIYNQVGIGVTRDGGGRMWVTVNFFASPTAQDRLVEVRSATLNVRATPGGRVIGQASRGQRFRVLRSRDGWIEVDYEGRGGWVSASLVRRV